MVVGYYFIWHAQVLTDVDIVTVDESICEIEGSEDEEGNEDSKSDICQLSKPMDGVLVQRQVLHALALEV